MKQISSLSNPIIKKYLKLKHKKYRKLSKQFLVEGEHLVNEALKAKIVMEILTSNPSKKGILVSNNIIKKLTTTTTPQDIVAVCKFIEHKFSGSKILAIDNIQDPGNLGTLIRTAKAFNYNCVIWSGVDPYNDKVIRSTQGALFSIPFIVTDDISKYFQGYQIIGTTLDQDAQKYDSIILKNKRILILGNEANGISQKIINLLDTKVYIPIHFNSLNVAQAGAILLNEYK